MNTSATGGALQPDQASFLTDDPLDVVLQKLVVAITALPGSLVRPAWQIEPPKQPDRDTNWCAIAVTQATADDGGYIEHLDTPDGGQDIYVRHEALGLTTSFYGPQSQALASQLRDGLAIPQNTEPLLANDIRWISCGAIISSPELINQQWYMRQDMLCSFRRKITRTYGVLSLLGSTIDLFDDTIINDTIVVPPA